MGAGYDTSFDPLPEIAGPSPFVGEGGLFGSGDMSGMGQMLAYSDASYTVQPGDNLSRIMGSSDPGAIGAVMRANGMNGSTIRPGQELLLPTGGYSSSDVALGQGALNGDNARLAALRQSPPISTGFYGSLDMSAYSSASSVPSFTPSALTGFPLNDTVAATPRTYITGFGNIPSYSGDFASPFPLALYNPKDIGELLNPYHSPSEIRSWIREAAAYNDVPYELAAVILQQENAPNATGWQKTLQFGERALTTAGAYVDEYAFGLAPDRLAGGSSGIANMQRATLRGGATYVQNVLGYPAIPENVSSRIFGTTVNGQIPGGDLKNDIYFLNAHLRQLIDRAMGQTGYSGPLTRAQVQQVAGAYNGSGPLAVKYGQDAVARIDRAVAGTTPLYFYERP